MPHQLHRKSPIPLYTQVKELLRSRIVGDSPDEHQLPSERDLAKELGVSISPRYGSWDPKTLLITGTVDDLSVPAAGEPSPTPSAG